MNPNRRYFFAIAGLAALGAGCAPKTIRVSRADLEGCITQSTIGEKVDIRSLNGCAKAKAVAKKGQQKEEQQYVAAPEIAKDANIVTKNFGSGMAKVYVPNPGKADSYLGSRFRESLFVQHPVEKGSYLEYTMSPAAKTSALYIAAFFSNDTNVIIRKNADGSLDMTRKDSQVKLKIDDELIGMVLKWADKLDGEEPDQIITPKGILELQRRVMSEYKGQFGL